MNGTDAVCIQQPCRSDHSDEYALATGRPKARTAIECVLMSAVKAGACAETAFLESRVILLLGVTM